MSYPVLDISLHEVFLYDTPLKSDIRPRPVSIFSDPVLSGQFLKSRGGPFFARVLYQKRKEENKN